MEFLNQVCLYTGRIIFLMGGLFLITFCIWGCLKMIIMYGRDQKLMIEFAQWTVNKKKQEKIKQIFPNIQRKDDI